MSAAEVDPVRAGLEGALNLQRVFTCNAETREARALNNYAGTKLALAELREQIASAINRGHLPPNFYSQLKEWTK